jgi:translation initiation factor IF-1
MASLYKTISVMSCSVLLGLGLFDVAASLDKIGDTERGKTIKGEVLRIEGDNYFVKNGEDGKVVRLHVDSTTQKKSVRITPGDNVEVKFNDQHHAISILTDQNQSH